jgi:glutathione S-transferase
MLAPAAKGLSYEPRRLDNSRHEQKSEAFLAVNPGGNVTVLVGGEVTVRRPARPS